jgi:predicted CoA-binding protein
MNDLFISYAHIDDQPLTEGAKGWISRLHRLLEIRLSQLMGERPNIWRDPTLQGSEIFGETIVRQLSEVKAMVSIVSPRYVKSDWCIREVEEFCKAAQPKGGIRCGHKSRVVKVVKTPVPSAEYPVSLFEIFNSQLGFEFFEIDQESGRAHEFSEELGEAAKQRFLEKVDDLAHDLCQLLKLLKDPLPPPSGKTVYLALSSFDVQRERDRIYRELVERGHTVLPNAPLPIVMEEFEKVVRADLARSQLAIHIVGSRYGMIPDGSLSSVVELQIRLSREQGSDPSFRRLIWLPNDLQTADEHQASSSASGDSRC